tara:strand:- start:443 stop:733 length:291 start_codon:yes stop_codon:yes gene_type:complete
MLVYDKKYYLGELIRILRDGRAKMSAAPPRRGYLYGRTIPSKRDCQSAMVMDIRALFNEAEMLKVDLTEIMDKPEPLPDVNELIQAVQDAAEGEKE